MPHYFSSIAEQLHEKEPFLSCNRGIILNMNYVCQANNEVFIMQDGKHLPLRRKDCNELLKNIRITNLKVKRGGNLIEQYTYRTVSYPGNYHDFSTYCFLLYPCIFSNYSFSSFTHKKVVLVTFLVEIVMFIFSASSFLDFQHCECISMHFYLFLFLRKNRCLTTFTFMVYIYECLSFRFLRLPFLLYNRYPFISPQHCSSLQSFNSTYDRAVFEWILFFLLAYPAKRYLGWLVNSFHEEKYGRSYGFHLPFLCFFLNILFRKTAIKYTLIKL